MPLHPEDHDPANLLTESAKRKLPAAIKAREARQAGSGVRETARRIGTRREANRSALQAANAALGIRRNNQTTDSNN